MKNLCHLRNLREAGNSMSWKNANAQRCRALFTTFFRRKKIKDLQLGIRCEINSTQFYRR